MPKVGTVRLNRGSAKPVEAAVYYQPPKGYKSAYFYVVIPGQYVIQNTMLLVEYKQGKSLHVVKGDTEIEAKAEAQKYIDWYAGNMEKRERLILIRTEDARYDYYYDGRPMLDEPPKAKASIKFEFLVFFRIQSGEDTIYEVDREWHDANSKTECSYVNYVDKGTVLPFSEQLAQQCVDMVEKLNQMNDAIREILGTPDGAMATLAKVSNLKLLGTS